MNCWLPKNKEDTLTAHKRYLIDSHEVVGIGDKNYYLRIRSDKPEGPVVLFLHGGPGNPDRHSIMKNQSPLAEHCTLVAWDQTGSGKAYNRKQAKEKISIDSLVEDSHQVVLFLKRRFKQEKIYIVGHSWGSVLGVLLSQRYPEDIAAYIGVGQLISGGEGERMVFQFVIDEAQKRHDKRGLRKLNKTDAPVNGHYQEKNGIVVVRNYLHKYGGATYGKHNSIWHDASKEVFSLLKEYSFIEVIRYFQGMSYTIKYIDTANIDFMKDVQELKVPVFLLLGHHDYNCPFVLGERWIEQLKAPEKQLVWFENSAHSPQSEEPGLFNRKLEELLR